MENTQMDFFNSRILITNTKDKLKLLDKNRQKDKYDQ